MSRWVRSASRLPTFRPLPCAVAGRGCQGVTAKGSSVRRSRSPWPGGAAAAGSPPRAWTTSRFNESRWPGAGDRLPAASQDRDHVRNIDDRSKSAFERFTHQTAQCARRGHSGRAIKSISISEASMLAWQKCSDYRLHRLLIAPMKVRA